MDADYSDTKLIWKDTSQVAYAADSAHQATGTLSDTASLELHGAVLTVFLRTTLGLVVAICY